MNKTSIYQREVTPMMQAATVFGLILIIFFGEIESERQGFAIIQSNICITS